MLRPVTNQKKDRAYLTTTEEPNTEKVPENHSLAYILPK
jgi:hypothetical protein